MAEPFPPVGYPFSDGVGNIVFARILNSIIEKIVTDFQGAVGPQGPPGQGMETLNAAEAVSPSLAPNTLILRRP